MKSRSTFAPSHLHGKSIILDTRENYSALGYKWKSCDCNCHSINVCIGTTVVKKVVSQKSK